MDKVFATQASGPGTLVKVECGSGERWERGDPWMVMTSSVSDLVPENRVGNDLGNHTVLSSGLHMHCHTETHSFKKTNEVRD